jgi:hypothetical protein
LILMVMVMIFSLFLVNTYDRRVTLLFLDARGCLYILRSQVAKSSEPGVSKKIAQKVVTR